MRRQPSGRMPEVRTTGVVGAGIVGLAVARRLLAELPGSQVTVLEKEDRVAAHQTGHNSGVVHAGLYYAPGSLKATLCRRGVGLLKEYCQERGLPYQECGKLVVAVDDGELARLGDIEARARSNGVPELARLDARGLREIEPHATGVAALHSPRTAITDYTAVSRALAGDIQDAGGQVLLSSPVRDVRLGADGVEVLTGGPQEYTRHRFDRLVVCAGLQSDEVATWAGDAAGPRIVPFRGEYFTLVPERRDLVNGLIYPVPDPAYPFLGVHFTRRVDGGVDVGPNAVLAAAREGYHRSSLVPRELWQTLSWPGFRVLARRHWRAGAQEMAGSLSRRLYLARAQRYVPELALDDVVPAPAGVRAQAVDADGSLVDDFRISELGPVTAIRNAPSPAATSSLAIAEHVVAQLLATSGA